jgi:hypothetical protein
MFVLFQVLQRLVNCLDRCASRTGSLPIQTVSLLPVHCSRFSLGCLQMMFSLCRCTIFLFHLVVLDYANYQTENTLRTESELVFVIDCSCTLKTSSYLAVSETSRASISILTKRCETILGQFLADENDLGIFLNL